LIISSIESGGPAFLFTGDGYRSVRPSDHFGILTEANEVIEQPLLLQAVDTLQAAGPGEGDNIKAVARWIEYESATSSSVVARKFAVNPGDGSWIESQDLEVTGGPGTITDFATVVAQDWEMTNLLVKDGTNFFYSQDSGRTWTHVGWSAMPTVSGLRWDNALGFIVEVA
jgi:hypothetical protein